MFSSSEALDKEAMAGNLDYLTGNKDFNLQGREGSHENGYKDLAATTEGVYSAPLDLARAKTAFLCSSYQVTVWNCVKLVANYKATKLF